MSLSAVVLAKDEEENIEECLKTLKFADEIIVIDDASTDKTSKIARKFGAKVFIRKLENNFAAQRNFGLFKAKGDWVLFIDADERVSTSLAGEIKVAISKTKESAYQVRRLDTLWGKALHYGEVGSTKITRLVRKGSGEWTRNVHEVWETDGGVGNLKFPLNHFPHPSVKEFVEKINYLSMLHSKANLKEGKKSSIVKIVLWPVGHFAVNFIFKMGFLDGSRGFIVAILMSFHSFLAWSGLWISQKH